MAIIPEDFWDTFEDRVTKAQDHLESMPANRRLDYLVEVLGFLELQGIVDKQVGKGYGIRLPVACYDEIVEELEENEEGSSRDLDILSQGIALHITMGHVQGHEWDPYQFLAIFKLAYANLEANHHLEEE